MLVIEILVNNNSEVCVWCKLWIVIIGICVCLYKIFK